MNKRGKEYLRRKLYDKAIEQFQGIIQELGSMRLPDTDYVSDAQKYIEKCKKRKQIEMDIVKRIISSIKDVVSKYRNGENEADEISINIKLDTPPEVWKEVASREVYRIIDRYGLPLKKDEAWPYVYYTKAPDLEKFERNTLANFL